MLIKAIIISFEDLFDVRGSPKFYFCLSAISVCEFFA